MKPRERLNVYFHMDKYVYKLFHVVNIGKTYEKPEFKFSGMGDITIHHKKVISESGVISDDDLDQSFLSTRSELTYHLDGAMMKKTPDHYNPLDVYDNPYGQGLTWTPINEIDSIQLIFVINMRRMNIFKPRIQEIGKSKVCNYICKDCGLFDKNGSYKAIVFLKNRKLNLRQLFLPDLYADTLCMINDKLDLCLYIQRASYTPPIPYKSNYFGNVTITPYAINTCNFFQKEQSNELMLWLFKISGIIYE